MLKIHPESTFMMQKILLISRILHPLMHLMKSLMIQFMDNLRKTHDQKKIQEKQFRQKYFLKRWNLKWIILLIRILFVQATGISSWTRCLVGKLSVIRLISKFIFLLPTLEPLFAIGSSADVII